MRASEKKVVVLRVSQFYSTALWGLFKKYLPLLAVTYKLFSLVQFTPYKINPEQNIII